MRKGKDRMVEWIMDVFYARSSYPTEEYAQHIDKFRLDALDLAEVLYADGFHQTGEGPCAAEGPSLGYAEGLRDGYELKKAVED